MKTEIEVKFLDVDIEEVRSKLHGLGAVCEQPMRLLRRVIFDTDFMSAKNAYLRVRDEGHKNTLTYKQFDSLSIDGAKEIEVDVSNFEGTVALIEAAGIPANSSQESKRESWKLDGVDIVIDEWPWLQPYIEIEGNNIQSVKDIAKRLGYDWEAAVFGDVMVAYRAQYPHLGEDETVGSAKELRFGDPKPALLQER